MGGGEGGGGAGGRDGCMTAAGRPQPSRKIPRPESIPELDRFIANEPETGEPDFTIAASARGY